MLDERGQIDFTGELLDLVEQLWRTYQGANGQPQGARERLVALAYVAAALRQDADAIWAQLIASPELAGLDVAGALQEALGAPAGEQAEALRAELGRRGWLGG